MDDVFEGGRNVVRFPSEQAARSLMDRVCDVEPGVREVVLAAARLGLVLPALDLRERVDEETARHIAEKVLPLALAERRLALEVLLTPVAAVALRACVDAAWASGHCAAVLGDVEQARREGMHWMAPLEERAEVLVSEAERLLVAAYGRCQEAHGVARAVGLARRGKAWTPSHGAEKATWPCETGWAMGVA